MCELRIRTQFFMRTLLDRTVLLIALLTFNSFTALELNHHPTCKSSLNNMQSPTKCHYLRANSCNISRYGNDTSLDGEHTIMIIYTINIGERRADTGNDCRSAMQCSCWVKWAPGNMTRFNHLCTAQTWGSCSLIVHIRVKNLQSGWLGEALSLSANYKPSLSTGQGDADTPWWMQACRGHKSVSCGACPHNQSLLRSTRPHFIPPAHAHTDAHVPDERFSRGYHLSHSVPQTHFWFAGKKTQREHV